jgi:drug/metabolite transporter (DMT)-like permease
MKREVKAHIMVLCANIIYGANYSIAKEVMPKLIKPFGFIVLRVLAAALLFRVTKKLLIKEKIDRSDFLRLFLCAVFGVVVNQLLFFKGLALTSPIDSGLMMVTNPIFVLLLSGIFLSEIINARRILGIVCGLSGAVILILFGNQFSNGGISSIEGDIYILINSLSLAVYVVMVKPLIRKYHPLTIMQHLFWMGAIMVLPFGWSEFTQIEWNTFSTTAWLATIFVVIGTTFLAYLLNTMALRELSAGVVSVYIYLQPLLATGFAILLGKDVPNTIHLVSALLIFSGVYLTTTGIAVRGKIVPMD